MNQSASELSEELELAKLQNTGPLIYISLNHKGPYCVILRFSKDFDTYKKGGPKWPCIRC